MSNRLYRTSFSARCAKICSIVATVTALYTSSTATAYAAHGAYNPMSPRQISQEAALADYSYGYSTLAGHAIDTLEAPNRMIWYLNYDLLDNYILRPVAHTYALLPIGVQDGVGHFLANLNEVNNIPNNLLIGRVGDASIATGRLILNSTIGLLGIFDVASHVGLEPVNMRFDTVLGKAGVQQGPYIMVPAYGPTTARDLQGAAVDGLVWYTVSWPLTLSKWVVTGIHNRAQLISQEAVVDNALDPYVTTRDVYLMYDEGKVNPIEDGEVSTEDQFDESLLDEIDG